MAALRLVVPLLLTAILLPASIAAPAWGVPGVVINEIVVDPQQDWGDSEGIPFDGTPGVGTVSASDECIEIANASGSAVDLTGWTLEMNDGTPVVLTLSNPGTTILAFSPGSTMQAFGPGARLVIGDPPGTMDNDVYLVLRDASSLIVDDVEIGEDPEGDGIGDGAPAPGLDGNASSLTDEAIARVPNAMDTDDDVIDFDQQAATIAAANPESPAVLVNEVVVDPQHDWNDSGGGIPFDDAPGAGAIDGGDEWIELYNASPYVLDVSGWRVQYIDGSPELLELGAPGTATLRCSPGSTTTALQPGGYIVIGDGPGSMGNQVHVVLLDAFGAMADDVEIGDDPELDGNGDGAPDPGQDGGSTGIADEVVARMPNGVDVGDDVADFTKSQATIGTANTSPVSVPISPAIPSAFGIEVSPNPIYHSAQLVLHLPESCRIELAIHDVAGREVMRQTIPAIGPGSQRLAWTVPSRSGVYWIRVRGLGAESERPYELVRRLAVVR